MAYARPFMSKLIKLSLIFFFILNFNCIISTKTVRGYSESKTLEAITIIIDDLDKRGLFKKEDMIRALNEPEHFPRHKDCNKDKHSLKIEFLDGELNEKGDRCIYSDAEYLKGKCLVGLFDGHHTIKIVKTKKLHQSSLAHELYHYFQRYLEDEPRPAGEHQPMWTWETVFGFGNWARGIGLVNETLKDKGY